MSSAEPAAQKDEKEKISEQQLALEKELKSLQSRLSDAHDVVKKYRADASWGMIALPEIIEDQNQINAVEGISSYNGDREDIREMDRIISLGEELIDLYLFRKAKKNDFGIYSQLNEITKYLDEKDEKIKLFREKNQIFDSEKKRRQEISIAEQTISKTKKETKELLHFQETYPGLYKEDQAKWDILKKLEIELEAIPPSNTTPTNQEALNDIVKRIYSFRNNLTNDLNIVEQQRAKIFLTAGISGIISIILTAFFIIMPIREIIPLAWLALGIPSALVCLTSIVVSLYTYPENPITEETRNFNEMPVFIQKFCYSWTAKERAALWEKGFPELALNQAQANTSTFVISDLSKKLDAVPAQALVDNQAVITPTDADLPANPSTGGLELTENQPERRKKGLEPTNRDQSGQTGPRDSP